MDAAMAVSDYLNSCDLGVASYLAVPSERPESFLVVSQTGGRSDEGLGWSFDVDVDCWAPTRARSVALADEVADALLYMPDSVEDVFWTEITSWYDNADLETSPPHPRHTVGAYMNAV